MEQMAHEREHVARSGDEEGQPVSHVENDQILEETLRREQETSPQSPVDRPLLNLALGALHDA